MRLSAVLVPWTVLFVPAAWALTLHEGRTASSVSEQTCVAPKAVSVFQPADRQAFVWFVALQVRAGDQLRVEWLDPSGRGFNYSGLWRAPHCGRVVLHGAASDRGIRTGLPARQLDGARSVEWDSGVFPDLHIAPDTDNGGPVVTSVTWPGKGSGEQAQEIDFTVRGKNFQPNSLVLIAQYKQAGGWTYLASIQPRDATANQLTAHYTGLLANEYLVIVENPDQRMSRPMPFLISTGGYKLPTAAGVPWIITQGPYGTFSHWGNSLHAFDIAPGSSPQMREAAWWP